MPSPFEGSGHSRFESCSQSIHEYRSRGAIKNWGSSKRRHGTSLAARLTGSYLAVVMRCSGFNECKSGIEDFEIAENTEQGLGVAIHRDCSRGNLVEEGGLLGNDGNE